MKIVKYLGLGLLILIVLLALVGFLLPSNYHVERSVSIKCKPADVFQYINNLKTWPDWTVWNTSNYADLKQEFHEPSSGAGASYSWTSTKAGSGTMKLVSADPEKGIAYELDFEHGKYPSKGVIKTEATRRHGLKVTWTNEGELGMNPIGRYFGLMMDDMLGADFQQGLENLKGKVEKK